MAGGELGAKTTSERTADVNHDLPIAFQSNAELSIMSRDWRESHDTSPWFSDALAG